MVPEGGGLLAAPHDPEDIARQLGAVLDAPERFDRQAIARAARERFGVEEVGRAFAEAYEEVLER